MPAVLPDSIGELQALTKLYLGGNRLTGEHLRSTSSLLTLASAELPSTIGNLKALTVLVLEENNLQAR